MRIRNLKNKEEILNNCDFLINNPHLHIGNWAKVFNNDNPIHIEIGMGKGKFITEMAKANPRINFIGIERYDSIVAKAIDKINEYIPNLRFIKMDAKDINEVFCKEVSLIYLNFSDPWPKKRHAKRRLTDENFLLKYDSVFKKDKTINLKTDNDLLFSSSIISLSNYGYKIVEISLDLVNSDIPNIMTEYETKFVSKGIKIKYLKAFMI